jgi:hypothetical protein
MEIISETSTTDVRSPMPGESAMDGDEAGERVDGEAPILGKTPAARQRRLAKLQRVTNELVARRPDDVEAVNLDDTWDLLATTKGHAVHDLKANTTMKEGTSHPSRDDFLRIP